MQRVRKLQEEIRFVRATVELFQYCILCGLRGRTLTQQECLGFPGRRSLALIPCPLTPPRSRRCREGRLIRYLPVARRSVSRLSHAHLHHRSAKKDSGSSVQVYPTRQ